MSQYSISFSFSIASLFSMAGIYQEHLEGRLKPIVVPETLRTIPEEIPRVFATTAKQSSLVRGATILTRDCK